MSQSWNQAQYSTADSKVSQVLRREERRAELQKELATQEGKEGRLSREVRQLRLGNTPGRCPFLLINAVAHLTIISTDMVPC